METALQSVMMESSIDYSSKFEKLAEHLADNTDASQPNMWSAGHPAGSGVLWMIRMFLPNV